MIPGWGRSPGGGNGNPLQYSCLENPMDRGSGLGYRVTKSRTRLKRLNVQSSVLRSHCSLSLRPVLRNEAAYVMATVWSSWNFTSPPGGVSSTHACMTFSIQMNSSFAHSLRNVSSKGNPGAGGGKLTGPAPCPARGESVREAWLRPGGCKHINSPSSNKTN